MFYYLCKVIRYVLVSHSPCMHIIIARRSSSDRADDGDAEQLLEPNRASCPRADVHHWLLTPSSLTLPDPAPALPPQRSPPAAPHLPAFLAFPNHLPLLPPNQTAPPRVSSTPPMALTKPSDRRRRSVGLRPTRPRTWRGGSCFGASWDASRCGNNGPNGASVGESLGKGLVHFRSVNNSAGMSKRSVHLDQEFTNNPLPP